MSGVQQERNVQQEGNAPKAPYKAARRRWTTDDLPTAASGDTPPRPGDLARAHTIANTIIETQSENGYLAQISAYRLRWVKLREYLQRKFPNYPFPDSLPYESDIFHVELPRKLTKDERQDIYGLRVVEKKQEDRVNSRPQHLAHAEPIELLGSDSESSN